MSAIAIIQARMSSSRLPGKVMMPLAGMPMIWHIAQRVQQCTLVDQVVVATSNNASDDPLARFCDQSQIDCFRGSLGNVLSRYIEVLNEHPHEYCVRITGDCPLIDPDFIDRQITALECHDGDHIWLKAEVPALVGQGVHSSRSLRLVANRSSCPDDLEHVASPYFAKHPEEFRIIGLQVPESLQTINCRITVDEPSDYDFMARLYGALWQGHPFKLEDALQWMVDNPQIASINQAIVGSVINQEVSKSTREWRRHLSLVCDWDDPKQMIS